MNTSDRRGFIRTSVGALLGIGVGSRLTALRTESAANADVRHSKIPTRRLGRTGYQPSVLSLGGGSTIKEPDKRDEAIAIINRALDLGVNYVDTASSYGSGASEDHFGAVLSRRRDEVFLATKTRQRQAERLIDREFEKSCERLQTRFVDLYFLHAVQSLSDLDAVLDRDDGAVLALEKLREQDRIGHIGISSHSSATLIEAMKRYDFDCMFVTLNPAGLRMDDPNSLHDMLAMAADRDIGVIGMKIIARGMLFERGITMKEALDYALSLPIATANLGITTMEQLEENVRLAKDFVPLDPEILAQLELTARA